ncbi:MAG: UbiD family decarboxylase [Deltaproteobacteria bacterium]|nr:UbiD family decarboxylase [Deltaproteobacteria bacterium]
MTMHDLRSWLQAIESLGSLKRVQDADPNIEIGIITELNCRRKGPALLFDNIRGFPQGRRILTGTILDAPRLGLALGYPGMRSSQELVSRLEGKMTEYELASSNYPPREVESGPVLENQLFGEDINLLQFPAPKWHEHDGGNYIGTGCVVMTRDPDSGRVNLGCYRVMAQDEKNVTIQISSAHHGAINLKKYHSRNEAAPVAVSLGHHPIYLVIGGLGIPYRVSEYEYLGAMFGEPVPVIQGKVTGLPIPAHSELAFEGFCSPNQTRSEGPFGEFTGYYGSGEEQEPLLEVKAVYFRSDPINLGAPPGRPPHDYSYMYSLIRSVMVKESLVRDGVPDVRGVWFHEVSGVNFFAVVSIKQRFPGHARQAACLTAQCQAAAGHLGRYVVVVDDDIDPSNLGDVIWAMGTRTNPEKDIDLLRNTYSSTLDPVYPKGARKFFGSRAIIDACRPYDWIEEFPAVAESSEEERQKVLNKWKDLFERH